MAARENGYCTSFILMSAQLDWERIRGNEPLSPFNFTVGWLGREGRGLGGLEVRFSGRVGRLWSVSASRGVTGALLPAGVTGALSWFSFSSSGNA